MAAIRIYLPHASEDAKDAQALAARLSAYPDVDCRPDDFAPHAGRTAGHLGDHLRLKLADATHALLYASRSACAAWWAAFVLGMAVEARCPAASYAPEPGDLPGYLYKWPILSTPVELDDFVRVARASVEVLLVDETDLKSASPSSRGAYSVRFYSGLRRALRQF